ncbi:MAG TPA: diaminobutyrate--2-oxoglutarate transaminase [Thermoanaerobaculia bacterium]|nr:diaminobutyrate--2-oxoglutarate transaminase [Thermoanaerobaculia bacterium]
MEVFARLESEVRLYSRHLPVVFARARNALMYDEAGNEYVDFFSGSGALNYGHNNPRLKRAVIEYLEDDGILHSLDMATVAKRRFLERFAAVILAPRGLRYKIQHTGPTGANAVEAALKLARKVTRRTNVVCFFNAFHGLSLGALPFTGSADKRQAAGVPLCYALPVPYEGCAAAGGDSLGHLESVLAGCALSRDLPAAILLETVQAEGGIRVASDRWLRAVAALAQRYGVLLIVDDIQAGCGRTGTFFSFEPAGIVPDLVTISKSIGGLGLPMSLVLIKPELDQWQPGEHTSTFRGINLAFVAATEALAAYWEDGGFEQEVLRKGELTRRRLGEIARRHPEAVAGIRGRGLINGLHLAPPELARQVVAAAFRRGLVIETVGPLADVVKLLPPLTIEDADLERGLERLAEALDEALAGASLAAAAVKEASPQGATA